MFLAQASGLPSLSQAESLECHVLPISLPGDAESLYTIADAHRRKSSPVWRPQCDGIAAVLLFSARLIPAKVIYTSFDIERQRRSRLPWEL
jgi:hypothetical protein